MVFQDIPGSSAGAAAVLRSSRFPTPSSNYVFANNLKKARNFTSCLTFNQKLYLHGKASTAGLWWECLAVPVCALQQVIHGIRKGETMSHTYPE